MLKPYKEQLPAKLFTEPFTLPKTDGRGIPRETMRKALALLGAVAPDLDKINAHLFEGVTTRDFRILRSSFQRLILRSASAKDLLKS